MQFVPGFVKSFIQQKIRGAVISGSYNDTQLFKRLEQITITTLVEGKAPVVFPKFYPFKPAAQMYRLPDDLELASGRDQYGLPVPPQKYWLGYGTSPEGYASSGKQDVDLILQAIIDSGAPLQPGNRILDFGCAGARMLRHFAPYVDTCEAWGTDIDADSIVWCRENLTPPFHFAVNTTLPHLPFPDHYFNLIYAGSVFTHIDDLTDSWLLELRRILAPSGRLYITFHDKNSLLLLDTKYPEHPFAKFIHEPKRNELLHSAYNVAVIGRGPDSQVFYERAYFQGQLEQLFRTYVVIPEAYGYQTAILLGHK